MNEILFLPVFLVGLLGSGHCAGMCGGFVGALSMGLPPSVRDAPGQRLRFHLSYNGGRLASYALAGMVAGAAGGVLWLPGADAPRALFAAGRWLGVALLVLFGLYLTGWWRGPVALERWGGHLWRHIEPLGRRWLPVQSLHAAFLLGMVWGWLPCGLVYGALAWALASGSAVNGTGIMLAFGLGTLPMMLGLGQLSVAARIVRSPAARQWVGIGMMALAVVVAVWPSWLPLPGGHAGHH